MLTTAVVGRGWLPAMRLTVPLLRLATYSSPSTSSPKVEGLAMEPVGSTVVSVKLAGLPVRVRIDGRQ